MNQVLSVGNCGYDDSRIGRMLATAGASADRAHNAEDARAKISAGHYKLILINRVLDADGSNGIDLLGALKKEYPAINFMLISDYPEAQQSAINNGALPGFGKSQLSDPETQEKVRNALAE